MQETSDRGGSESDIILQGEDGDFGETIGDEQGEWIVNLEIPKKDLSCYLKSSNSHYYIIASANKLISLSQEFDKLNVKFINQNSASGWNKKTSCIFPDHSDSSPSFSFNESENFFHCFGCGRSGGPVQLIAYLENRELIDVAQEIVGRSGEQQVEIDLDMFVQENLSSLKNELFAFGEAHYTFLEKHKFSKEASFYAEKIFSAFDFYVRNAIKINSFNEEEMKARIKICKNKLDNYI